MLPTSFVTVYDIMYIVVKKSILNINTNLVSTLLPIWYFTLCEYVGYVGSLRYGGYVGWREIGRSTCISRLIYFLLPTDVAYYQLDSLPHMDLLILNIVVSLSAQKQYS